MTETAPWNGLPPNPERSGAHWLRSNKTGRVALCEWSSTSQCWFYFGVSGSDKPDEMARCSSYFGPCFEPEGEATVYA